MSSYTLPREDRERLEALGHDAGTIDAFEKLIADALTTPLDDAAVLARLERISQLAEDLYRLLEWESPRVMSYLVKILSGDDGTQPDHTKARIWRTVDRLERDLYWLHDCIDMELAATTMMGVGLPRGKGRPPEDSRGVFMFNVAHLLRSTGRPVTAEAHETYVQTVKIVLPLAKFARPDRSDNFRRLIEPIVDAINQSD